MPQAQHADETIGEGDGDTCPAQLTQAFASRQVILPLGFKVRKRDKQVSKGSQLWSTEAIRHTNASNNFRLDYAT